MTDRFSFLESFEVFFFFFLVGVILNPMLCTLSHATRKGGVKVEMDLDGISLIGVGRLVMACS